jgi:hypothetical protein
MSQPATSSINRVTALTAVMEQGEADAYRKPQLMRLKCLECGCRFIKAVTHWRQIDLREQRKAEVAAIRCPACGSNKFDSDPHRE